MKTTLETTQAPEPSDDESHSGISGNALTRECPLCEAEMVRSDVLTKRAVNDRDEDAFSPIWTCSGCGHEIFNS